MRRAALLRGLAMALAVLATASFAWAGRSVDPATVAYTFGPDYAGDVLTPSADAAIGRPYILRDYRGVAVRWNPFRYNPATGTLRVHGETTIEIATAGISARNVLERGRIASRPVRAFADLYRDHFMNYSERQAFAPSSRIDEEGEMLVICHDAWVANLAPLVTHKWGRGITTTVIPVSEIGNDAVSIKNYIQNYYATHNLAFVLLVGDSAQVATPLLNGYDAADPTYAKLAGADDYPDVLVGRMSAQTVAQVDTQIARTIDYENVPANGQDWYRRGVGIASSKGGAGTGDDGQSDREHEDEIRGWLLGAGWTLVDQIYDPGATDRMVESALNTGRGIVNYTGHGNERGWDTSGFNTADVDALVNKDQLPFIVSVGCNNGEFNHFDPCFAEAWLRASKDGRPTGAVAAYMSSVEQSWAPPMESQDEFNLRLTDSAVPYRSFGALCFAGSASMISAYGSVGVAMADTWHVFGDPSIQVAPVRRSGLVVEPAGGLAAWGRTGGPFSPASRDYTLTNFADSPLEYNVTPNATWVSASPARGTIPASGFLVVTVGVSEGAADLDLGSHASSVRFTNLTDHEGDTTRGVSLAVDGSLGLALERLDTDPGWSREGDWAFGRPTGGGGGGGFNPDPTSGYTGTNVFGVNLGGDIPASRIAGPFYLKWGPINLSGVHGASLRFERWLNTAGPPAIQSTIDVSANNSTWTTVWSADSDIADNHWTPQGIDISTVADDQPTVWVRWGYQVVVKLLSGAGSGWNIDDPEIHGGPTSARIALSVERDRLQWIALESVPLYDLVRGGLGELRDSLGDFAAATNACLANDVSATTVANADTPAEGTGLWYLVRGVGRSGELTYQDLDPSQSGARDAEIDASASSCP